MRMLSKSKERRTHASAIRINLSDAIGWFLVGVVGSVLLATLHDLNGGLIIAIALITIPLTQIITLVALFTGRAEPPIWLRVAILTAQGCAAVATFFLLVIKL